MGKTGRREQHLSAFHSFILFFLADAFKERNALVFRCQRTPRDSTRNNFRRDFPTCHLTISKITRAGASRDSCEMGKKEFAKNYENNFSLQDVNTKALKKLQKVTRKFLFFNAFQPLNCTFQFYFYFCTLHVKKPRKIYETTDEEEKVGRKTRFDA